MGNKDNEESVLDSLFEAARSNRPTPDTDFMARLRADAVAAAPKPEAVAQQEPVSLILRLKTLFAASGLSSAAALGIWLGFVMPDLVTPFSATGDDVTAISAFLAGADLSVLSE